MGKIPDEMVCKRYRREYRGERLYIIVTEDEQTGMPFEVFVRFDQEGKDPTKFLTESGIEALTRLLSGWLQHPDVFPLKRTIRQLQKSSITKKDIPGILSDILESYEGKSNEKTT